MIEMDFTTTAMSRPRLVEQTLKSFTTKLKGVDFKKSRLIINIDPLPPNIKRKEVIAVARQFFGTVVYNLPKVANFTAAVNWTWSRAETEYIFHLEDDWELLRDVPVGKLVENFDKNKALLQIILRAYRYPYRTCALSPSIIHARMYRKIAGKLNETVNPEAQLRGERFGVVMPKRGKGSIRARKTLLVYPEKPRQIILKDLGRAWINKTRYKKTGGGKKAQFLTWETKIGRKRKR
jgi:hypothetical protein